MPPKKPLGKKKVAWRKRSNKNSLKSNNSTIVGKEVQPYIKSPLPKVFRGSFRYAETFNLTTGTSGVMGTQQVMNLNCLYDPNYTGAGHQPYGFDQIQALYQKYQVDKVKVTLIWTTPGGTADVLGAYKVQANSGAGNLTGNTCDYSTEQPQTGTVIVTSSGNNRVVETNFWVDIKKLFNVTKAQYAADVYISQSYSSSQPNQICQLMFAVGSPSGSTGESCTVQCILEFRASFFERIDQAQS